MQSQFTSSADASILPPMGQEPSAKLRNSTVVFLVGDLAATARWYERIGFEAELFPPGFAILTRDDVQSFRQHADGYVKPDDPAARHRDAWNVYIETDNVHALFDELSNRSEVTIGCGLTRESHGQIEFDITDPNGYELVFAQPTE